jgi:hypothetical protein
LPGNLLVPCPPCRPAASLKGGTALVNLLRNAVETSSDEDGWEHLATVGSIITKHGLDFDSRTYGYAKLSDLLLRRHLPREMDWWFAPGTDIAGRSRINV